MSKVVTVLVSGVAALISTATAADPVFAPGQAWNMSFQYQGKTMTRELVVGPLEKTEQGMYFYRSEWYTLGGLGLQDRFKYDPVDSDPEFIQASLSIDMNAQDGKTLSFTTEKLIEEACYVRSPGRVKVGQTLRGALIRTKGITFGGPEMASVVKYIKTGKLAGVQPCTLKRVK